MKVFGIFSSGNQSLVNDDTVINKMDTHAHQDGLKDNSHANFANIATDNHQNSQDSLTSERTKTMQVDNAQTPNSPNNNPSNNTPNHNPPNNGKKSAMARFMRLLFWLVVVLAFIFVLLYLSLGSQTGSRLILEKIAAETGVSLKYGKGNLRDGLWVSDIKIAEGSDVEVVVDKAFVQIGWRAVLARQVHIASADIDTIAIVNHKPPSDEPFDYATIAAPVALKLDNASIHQIIYKQIGKDTLGIQDIAVKSATWRGNEVTLTGGNINITDMVTISDAQGKILLDGEYPLSASAQVVVASLDGLYIDPFVVQANGTLKRTTGTVTSKYNKHSVTGKFVVQGMDSGVPFWASLSADKVILPYATSQDITLTNATVTASGVAVDTDIDLRIHTDLDGKDIPKGLYHGRAKIHKDGMDIPSLTAHTEGGKLVATGSMSWQDKYTLHATAKGQGVTIAPLIPKDYQDYAVYAPKTLDGQLGFDFGVDDGKGNAWYEISLNQDNGEQLTAHIHQDEHGTDYPKGTTIIHADWQNLVRANLPNIGAVNSPQGIADITYHDGTTTIKADGQIKTLSVAPSGHYVVDSMIADNVVTLHQAYYQGEMGDLSATGVIHLADDDNPLRYDFRLNTKKLSPNVYLTAQRISPTPIAYLTGTAHATGQMTSQSNRQKHHIDIKEMNLTAALDNKGGQTVSLIGAGGADIGLIDTNINHLQAYYDGQLKSTGIHTALQDNRVSLALAGDMQKLEITKLVTQGEMGNLSAAGQLRLTNGIGWDLSAHADGLNTALFYDKSQVVATGDVTSKGTYQNGVLKNTTIALDSTLYAQNANQDNTQNKNSKTGKLSANATLDGKTITLHALDYQGQAGKLTATGTLDTAQGYVGQVQASLTNFDTGYFVKDYQSDLTGDVNAQVNWQKNEQKININQMNVQGVFNQENFVAKGAMQVVLDLPSNLSGYFNALRQNAKHRFDKDLFTTGRLTDRIDNLQNALSEQNFIGRQLIKKINADDVVLLLGENRLSLDGNEQKLALDINAKTLSQIIPTVRGAISGGLVLIQESHELPTFYIDAKADGLAFGSFAIRDGSIIGKVVNLANSDSQLLINANHIIAAGKSLSGLRLDFRGTQAKHNLALMVDNDDMQVRAKVSGSLDDSDYQGIVSEGRLQTKAGILNQRQPTEINYNFNAGRTDIAAHCWQTVTTKDSAIGSICLQKTLTISPTMGDVSAVIQNLDTSVFSPILPADLTWQARLHGKIDAKWGKGISPNIDAVVYSDNGTVGLRAKDSDDVVLPYKRVSIIAKSVPTGLKLRTDINAGQGGDGYVDIIVNPFAENNNSKTIAGALVLNNLKLEILRPFFPAIQSMAGNVNLAGGVGGTLAKPLFYGNASLADGRFSLVDVPVTLTKINLDASVRGTNASLDGSFNSGKGAGLLTGNVDWSSLLQAKFDITGDNLEITKPPLLSAKVTPHVEIVVRPSQKFVDIKGVLSVPSATIRPPETTATVIEESPDVTVIDRRASGNVADILAVVEPWNINADMGLDLGNDVVFRGFGATLPLAGALHLTQKGQGVTNAHGVIQVSKRTKVDAIGQNLDLNYAQIRFNGDMLNPRLSIEASREISSNTVGVRVKGRLSNPNITVFNDAGLTEQQAMNALVTGSIDESGSTQISEQGFKSQVTNNLAAAGLSLGLQGTRGLTNEIGRAFGLDSLVVDASGGSDDANVNVTGYITPDLYIRYGVGVFNAKSTLSMRYQLTRRIYVEATSATENFVDVVYRWRF